MNITVEKAKENCVYAGLAGIGIGMLIGIFIGKMQRINDSFIRQAELVETAPLY